jgi:hypothetical protein
MTMAHNSILYLLNDVRPADMLSALYLHAIYARERGNSEHARLYFFNVMTPCSTCIHGRQHLYNVSGSHYKSIFYLIYSDHFSCVEKSLF